MMAKRRCIAIFEPAEPDGYGIYLPDLPGCVSFGATVEQGLAQAHEAVSLHLTGLDEDGLAKPAIRTLAALDQAGELPLGMIYASIFI